MVPSTHPQKVRLLYKTILRLHRALPPELKLIGKNHKYLFNSNLIKEKVI